MAKKKYSINWEDDIPVSFEVNSAQYASLEEVPDEADQRKLEAMLDSSFDTEFAEMEKEVRQINSPAVEKVILTVFSSVAALMLFIAAVASISNILKLGREESASGLIVDVVERRQYVNEQDRVVEEYYYPVVEFVASDGRRRTIPMNEGSSSPQYEVGEEVTVLYEPEHPLGARIKSVGSSALMWILPGITGILGVAFLGAVIAVRKLMPPKE